MTATGAPVILRSWAAGWQIKMLHTRGWYSPSEHPLISAVVSTCKNVFVTDGACMTSTGPQSPTTFMMLTAWVADYAVEEFKQKTI